MMAISTLAMSMTMRRPRPEARAEHAAIPTLTMILTICCPRYETTPTMCRLRHEVQVESAYLPRKDMQNEQSASHRRPEDQGIRLSQAMRLWSWSRSLT